MNKPAFLILSLAASFALGFAVSSIIPEQKLEGTK